MNRREEQRQEKRTINDINKFRADSIAERAEAKARRAQEKRLETAKHIAAAGSSFKTYLNLAGQEEANKLAHILGTESKLLEEWGNVADNESFQVHMWHLLTKTPLEEVFSSLARGAQ